MSNLLTTLKEMSPEELKLIRNFLNMSDAEEKNEVLDEPPLKADIIQKQSIKKNKNPLQSDNLLPNIKRKSRRTTTEPVTHGYENKERPNLFFEKKWNQLHKKDSRIDKQLWGENISEERGVRIPTIEVACNRCNNIYNVSPALLISDPSTHEVRYTCDNCLTHMKE